jgi:hypothetical protein
LTSVRLIVRVAVDVCVPSETISTMLYVVDAAVSLSKTVDVDIVPVDDNMLK